jgi:hypothetical protein
MNLKKLFVSLAEEILVIIDFCRFGNLKSYLIEQRDKFINQLNALGNLLPEDETVEINTPKRFTINILMK